MTNQEKRRIAVLLVLLLIVVIVKIRMGGSKEKVPKTNEIQQESMTEDNEFVEELEDGTKLNKSEVLGQAKTLGTLEFTNIQLTNQKGQTLLLADVKNTGTEATKMQIVEVVILDKKGGEIGRIKGIVAPLEAGENIQFNTSTTRNYANAYDFQLAVSE